MFSLFGLPRSWRDLFAYNLACQLNRYCGYLCSRVLSIGFALADQFEHYFLRMLHLRALGVQPLLPPMREVCNDKAAQATLDAGGHTLMLVRSTASCKRLKASGDQRNQRIDSWCPVQKPKLSLALMLRRSASRKSR